MLVLELGIGCKIRVRHEEVAYGYLVIDYPGWSAIMTGQGKEK